jgi:hypothetical protein
LRAAVKSIKTTPTEARKVTLCLTPMDLAVIGAARFTAYRLNYQVEQRNTGLGHMTPESLHKYPFTLKQDRIL